MKRLLLALVSVLFASGVHIASFAGVVYEYREVGSSRVIGTLEVASPPASASIGWSTAAPSDLIALFLDDAVFFLGSANLLFVGGTLGPPEILSLDGTKLDGGGFGIQFPTIFPAVPTNPIIDQALSISFDPSSGGDFIGVATRFTFPDGSVDIGDLFIFGNWVAQVPEPSTLALLGLGLAGLAFIRRRAMSPSRGDSGGDNGMRLALRNGLRIFSVGVFVALMVGVAQAVPFHYSESADGDLAGVPSTAFSFGFGNNTISGSTHLAVNIAGPGPHYDTDFDSFAIALPAGSRLVNISLAFTTASSNTVSADAELRLCLGVSNCLSDVLGYQTVSFFDAPPLQVAFGGTLPPSAGTYSLFTSGLGIGPAIDLSLSESWSVDYEWTLRVISVPEPSDLLLFGLGLAGLAFTRRRKQ